MEGEKERWRQQGEEKESNEAEDDTKSDEDADNEHAEGAALDWQEGYSRDSLCIPIMHWEALSLHIAELEKQEEEKKKTAKESMSLERGRTPVSWREEKGRRVHSWEDGDMCTSPVLSLTSRLQTHMNLQLCFINNSESEDEEEEKTKEDIRTKGGNQSMSAAAELQRSDQPSAKPEKPKARGFKNTLRNLRARLRTDHKALNAARCNPAFHGKHLEAHDLQSFCVKDLTALCASLSKAIQDLSSELVSRLQARDELRMEQDAMLLEVQDLTSV
ncbi:schwannomin-interacting protein 1 [Gouania willdenowi]|uniref:schwannomin-interacting protein 1 n=1 Tax=Gouania willdenowi TaxID=441366 RepID=UPI001056CCC2|nr:schwannomin-interacting protein 1-like [Gouania willdenowi]